MSSLTEPLRSVASSILPRILTQACRDAGNPAYGCFDRNWWHYKIRDFPSIILQQGGYAIWLAAKLPEWKEQADGMRSLAAGACRFWNARAEKHGAFEEYYPWEQGYPPLAFSTLAVMKMASEGAIPPGDVRAGAVVAAKQLASRFEAKAANQQVAGLAALAWVRRNFTELVRDDDFDDLSRRTLALQDEEGWYMEYGGSDVGYLAVTIDCLFDLFDVTGNRTYLESARKAADFIKVTTHGGTHGLGMLNARNTDYLVPYGLFRLYRNREIEAEFDDATFRNLFGSAADPEHFFHVTDDRYLCHYIGQSVLRALVLAREREEDPPQHPKTPARSVELQTVRLSNCGYVLAGEAGSRPFSLSISTKKGGVFTVQSNNGWVVDFGWVINEASGVQHVTHWWSDAWEAKGGIQSVEVHGSFFLHNETESSPFKHMVLRLVSLTLGRRIIQKLKDKLIFKRKKSPYKIRRRITWDAKGIRVEDRISGLDNPDWLHRAPRTSKRHVASADSYHSEDFSNTSRWTIQEERREKDGAIEIKATYKPQ